MSNSIFNNIRVILLDRDGVINEEPGPILSPRKKKNSRLPKRKSLSRFRCWQSNKVIFLRHLKKHIFWIIIGNSESAWLCFPKKDIPVRDRMRNTVRRPGQSFWLQTSTDKFYPDFVCKLKDDRVLVVEYKGQLIESNQDSQEKQALGELWAKRSGGKCLFAMPKNKDYAAVQRTI